MAQPFLRIDLSNEAKDFQNTVIEAGWPLLDKTNTNYQILRKWLGASVAEPDRKGPEVLFYLRNEAGARIDQPACLKVSERELTGPFKGELQTLVKKLQTAEPKNAAEKTLHAVALKELQAVAAEGRGVDRRCYLFKHRDEKKQWRLVWCPGYRRKDEQPVSPMVCTHPDCSLLFLQRADSDAKCPRCKKKPGAAPVVGDPIKWRRLILAALLLLALLGGGWWYFNGGPSEPAAPTEPGLIVKPEKKTISKGGEVKYVVTFRDEEGNEEPVSNQDVVPISKNPKVARFEGMGTTLLALSPGTAVLEFHTGKYSTQATLVVEPPKNPKRVKLEPAELTLGVGTTTQLRFIGEHEPGRDPVNLTNAAEWNWDQQQDSGVFVYRGLVEGLEAGEFKIRARYRATPESDYLIAEADVKVLDQQYKSLSLALASAEVPVGQAPGLTVEVVTEKGEKLSVLGSALLKLEVSPKELAEVQRQQPYLYTQQAGEGTLTATFRGLTAQTPLKVVGAAPSDQAVAFQVHPQNLKLSVGEIADLEVPRSSGGEDTRFASTAPDVVEITPDNRLIGRKPGPATVTVTRGDQEAKVEVEVAQAGFRSLAIEPAQVSVRVDDVAALRAMATIDGGTQIEIDPEMLKWVRFPREDYVEVNRQAFDVKGLKPTESDTENLTVKLGELEATAEIRVLAGPLTLVLEPTEPVELPVGQKQPLTVYAGYGNGTRVEVPANRVEWLAQPVEGLTLSDGEVAAEKPQAGPLLVSVRYQGQTSNEVKITAGHPVPVRLALAANPSTVAVGETGQLAVSAQSPGGQPVVLDKTGVKYQSGDEATLQVHPDSGGFRAVKPGQVTVTATHPSSREPVTAEIQVTAADPMTPAKPEGVRIVTSHPQPIALPLGVAFVDLKVEADVNGEPRNVTLDSTFTVEGDPNVAAVVVRNNSIVAVRKGSAVVKAEFGGKVSENQLTFNVTAEQNFDAIQVDPPSLTLTIGENTRLEATGFVDGRPIGLITDLPSLEWKSRNPEVLSVEGSLVSALAEGTGGVTAQIGSLVSNPVTEIRVVGSAATTDRLTVTPAAITLRPGESVHVGVDVLVRRGAANFSGQAVVAPANPEIVAYDPQAKTLQGLTPGDTRVTFAVGDQTAVLDVTVLSTAAPVAGGRVVIEPASSLVAVGERLALRVFVITADGERLGMTASALLGSSDAAIATVSGTALQGVAPGNVTISARVPGVETPGTAEFQVEKLEFTRLEVTPPRLDLSVGQRRRLEISGIGTDGRRVVGDHPDLQLSLTGTNQDIVDLSTTAREVLGVRAGQESLVVRWRGLEVTVPIQVTADPLTGIEIHPADATLEVGQTLDYQVFARRGTQLQPLSSLDGVDLNVSDETIASRPAALRVRGESVGVTQLVAQYGTERAVARLRVIPRSQPVAPPAAPVGIRFLLTTFQMELGTPGDNVRVIRVNADGSSEDVGHLATLTASPEGVVEITHDGAVPVIRPAKIGQTQLQAQVGDLHTQTPMLVEVADKLPGRARVVVQPSPLGMAPGDVEAFSRVAVVPPQGGSRIELPYRVTATPNAIFDVENDRTIRAKSPGSALATITITDPASKYDGLSTTAIVEVAEPQLQNVLRNNAELVLSGPSETTVGSEVAFRVELVNGSNGQEVTNDSTLVLAAGDERLATLQPGCRLIARQPGTISISARYADPTSNGLTSNAHELRINPVATDFLRLELALDAGPLGVGESRSYHVWGHPRGGGPRQDLTGLITDDPMHATHPHVRFQVLEPNAEANVAAHTAPTVIGRSPGTISLEAAIGELVSNRVELEVGGLTDAPIDLRVEPGSITSRVGETTPPLKVLVRMPGDRAFRQLDLALAEFASLDTDVLAPIAETPGRFTAERPGEGSIRVAYQGQETKVKVTVVADRFQNIEFGELASTRNTFTVPITVRANRVAGNLEYRVYKPGTKLKAEEGWKETIAQGDTQSVRLQSPEFPLARNNVYRVVIEARDKSAKKIDTYPYTFKVIPGQVNSGDE